MVRKTRGDVAADNMIKWLATEKEKDSVVYEKGVEAFSEDPLATIAGLYNKKYERTYSVNRLLNAKN